MKLWCISQSINNDYDTYDSAVVAAETEDDARNLHPGGGAWERDAWQGDGKYLKYKTKEWVAHPRDVDVRLIGAAVNGTTRGVVCASFNAG